MYNILLTNPQNSINGYIYICPFDNKNPLKSMFVFDQDQMEKRV